MPAVTKIPAGVEHFTLPSLELNFGSLTEGTNIPPPLPSPIQEVPTPPETPTEGEADANRKEAGEHARASTSKAPASDALEALKTGVKRAAEDLPTSPTTSKRSSIRRIFSRNILNTNLKDAHAAANHDGLRPSTMSDVSSVETSKKLKRSSGWFSRLRLGGDGTGNRKRASMINPLAASGSPPASPPSRLPMTGEDPAQTAARPAPPRMQVPLTPPPMIPELSELKNKVEVRNTEALAGGDWFKEVNGEGIGCCGCTRT